MIVVRVDGGLGNQMFQVAFGMELAERHRAELRLDLSAYSHQPAHGYQLDKLEFDAPVITAAERRRLPVRYRDPHARRVRATILAQFRELVDRWSPVSDCLTRVREKPFGYSPHYLQSADNSYLVGYWQSSKFFPSCQAKVREAFRVRGGLSSAAQRLSDRMLNSRCMALHIRRGDYVTDQQASSIYRNLGLDYYRHCVMDQLAQQSGVEVYVFSNDLDWCQHNLSLPCKLHFVSRELSAGAHEEMWLMTAASAIAMANSTFSWWGAWLSERQQRTVYCPRYWFQPGTLSDRDLPADGWTLVDDATQMRASSANSQSNPCTKPRTNRCTDQRGAA